MKKIILTCVIVLGLAGIAPVQAGQSGKVEFLNSKMLPKGLPFSEAVKVGHTLYLSGQIGIVPGTKKLAAGGMEGQARQAMSNIKTTLESHGYSMDDLVQCHVMLADIKDWGAFNKVYKTFFSKHFPARSAFAANGLALGAKVEVECTAAVGN